MWEWSLRGLISCIILNLRGRGGSCLGSETSVHTPGLFIEFLCVRHCAGHFHLIFHLIPTIPWLETNLPLGSTSLSLNLTLIPLAAFPRAQSFLAVEGFVFLSSESPTITQ